MVCVLVFTCCYIKSPHIYQFKQCKYVILQFYRSEDLYRFHWTKISVSRAIFISGASRR